MRLPPLDRDPLLPAVFRYQFDPSCWPARWIAPPGDTPASLAMFRFRRVFELSQPGTVRLHVSGDQRYLLVLDGRPLGRGPERGSLGRWHYESYEVELPAGRHELAARVTWLGLGPIAPYAQFTARPALLVQAEGMAEDIISTGVSRWQVKRLPGWSIEPHYSFNTFLCTGARFRVHADAVHAENASDGWEDAVAIGPATLRASHLEAQMPWVLSPALLPAMFESPLDPAPIEVRHVDEPGTADAFMARVEPTRRCGQEMTDWVGLLRGKPLVIPPRTRRRVIVDLRTYACFYPRLRVGGGRGATVRVESAEALFSSPEALPHHKQHRDAVDGMFFRGLADVFECDGTDVAFESPWWLAGRYVQVDVRTADEPLELRSLQLAETHYPYRFESHFECAESGLDGFVPTATRALQACSHETFMDCPYYEQLMYVGDTRLQALVAMATCRDAALPRKAVLLFDDSRGPDGWTRSRFPSRVPQTIPTFSLWWVCMTHDYARWRDDPSFVRRRLTGVRAVVNAVLEQVNGDGLIEALPGWNFVDWVGHWPKGMPPGAENGVNACVNLHAVLALDAAADLERGFGEPALAERCERHVAALFAAMELFWDESRGAYAEDPSRAEHSEHAQALAILTGRLPGDRRQRVLDTLLKDRSLTSATIYFSHYVLEALRAAGRVDALLDRLGYWNDLAKLGFVTTPERPEPTRSDCHAWGAHPVYHLYASILGIRPVSFGFDRVEIRPQLGRLSWARGRMVHPRGFITADLQQRDGGLSGSIELPPGVRGTLVLDDAARPLAPGVNPF